MYKPRKQKCAKVKAPATATQEDEKEYHKILQHQDSYHTKVKALKYLEFTQDTIGHQKVMEKLSAPKIPPPPVSFPTPCRSPGGGGGVTWSTQNFSLRLIVLLCGWLCCGALPLASLALMVGHFAHFQRNGT